MIQQPLYATRLSKQTSSSSSQNGFNAPILFNCIHCEEEQSINKESTAAEEEFSKYDGSQGVDKKDYRLCQNCMNSIISDLQSQISDAAEEIRRLQEKSHEVENIIAEAQGKFGEEEYNLLEEREKDLSAKIIQTQKDKENLDKEVEILKGDFCSSLKEEGVIEEEILDLEKQIHDLLEMKSIQDCELSQINEQIKELESQSFLKEEFRISFSPNLINGFTLGQPTEKNYMDFNHGMGQLTLLLEFLKKQNNYTSRKIKAIQCNGAVSKIERSQGLTLDLFCKLPDTVTNHSNGSQQRLYIPFEGIREFCTELLDFYKFMESAKNKIIKDEKNNFAKQKHDNLERLVGELQGKQDIKDFWDSFFCEILSLLNRLIELYSGIV